MEKTNLELKMDAAQIRLYVLESLRHLRAGHIGGCMSMAEVLAVLYGGAMRCRPEDPSWEGRDWLVVSKGHCGPAVYAALALHGYFSPELLPTVNTGGTTLPSHCDRNRTPGVDMTTGSLGQGMSTAIGTALGNRMQGRDNKTFLILGDGEMQEGQVWEGALFAAQKKVDNLIAFVDWNKKQLDGYVEDICGLGDIAEKFRAFGWNAETVDGHDVALIRDAVARAGSRSGKPNLIVLDTVKGKDCSFAEHTFLNHHMRFSEEQLDQAVAALRRKLENLREEAAS